MAILKSQKKLPLRERGCAKGFTLIELLLYVSIVSVMLLSTSVFLVELLKSRVKNQTIAEVEQQGLQVIQLVTQAIRNAEALNIPSQGGSSPLLTLDVMDVDNDPTVFDLADGAIRIVEGGGGAISLTNSRVVASELMFQNLSRVGTSGTLRIQFTLSHVNPENRNEYSYEKTFTSSATLRQP